MLLKLARVVFLGLVGAFACNLDRVTGPRTSLAMVDEGLERTRHQLPASQPTIVLVHGAFADASSWQDLIPLLEGRGFRVTAVQNTLTSLADDIATTRRVIDAQAGPVVLV